jgi:hypothetical protein
VYHGEEAEPGPGHDRGSGIVDGGVSDLWALMISACAEVDETDSCFHLHRLTTLNLEIQRFDRPANQKSQAPC